MDDHPEAGLGTDHPSEFTCGREDTGAERRCRHHIQRSGEAVLRNDLTGTRHYQGESGG